MLGAALQAHRGQRGLKARWGDNEDKRVSARLMAAKGLRQAEIARELGVQQGTVSKWLRSHPA